MIYRTLALVALTLASVSAVPAYGHRASRALSAGRREARIAKLQAVSPATTKAACEACVNAEDDLIAKLTTEEGALAAAAEAAGVHAEAAQAHDDALTALEANDGVVDSKKAAVQAIVTGDQEDLDVDSPPGIISSTTPLEEAALAWKNAIDARGKQQVVVDEASQARADALAAAGAANKTLGAASAVVVAARGAADAACSLMRTVGYPYDPDGPDNGDACHAPCELLNTDGLTHTCAHFNEVANGCARTCPEAEKHTQAAMYAASMNMTCAYVPGPPVEPPTIRPYTADELAAKKAMAGPAAVPTGAVLCPGQPAANYCDGTGDCTNQPTWCACEPAQALCAKNGTGPTRI